jgi:hypothetical protein
MTVRVIIGDEAIEKAQSKPVVAKLEMIIRRTMDGDYMIMDHTDVDIIVMPKKMKVVAFPKNLMSDLVYSTENRLFKFLSKKGLISVSSIQAGSIYGSLEAKMLTGETHDTVKLTLLNIQKWIEEERPYFEFIDKFEDMMVDRFVDPDDEHSTELGEIPHDTAKGASGTTTGNAHHWMSYTYE